jgi:23S rRNA pseudouridine2605 synthase
MLTQTVKRIPLSTCPRIRQHVLFEVGSGNTFVKRMYAKLVTKKDTNLDANMETNIKNNIMDDFIKITDKDRQRIIHKQNELYTPTVTSPLNREGSERLSKYLARIGMCSKRQGEELLRQGKVLINGQIAPMGTRITPSDKIVIDGQEVSDKALQNNANQVKLYAYHKPRGMLTSRVDEQKRRRTLHDFLAGIGMGHLMPIGRLDFNSEGLILLTNDGKLAQYMMHPSTAMQREYIVRIHGQVTQEHLDKFKRGVNVMGEHFGKMDVKIKKLMTNTTWIHMTLYEGKNREIRKIFQQFGMAVNRLKRIKYGPYELRNLQKNSIRQVNLTPQLLQHCNPKFE